MSERSADPAVAQTHRLVVRCAVRSDVGRVRPENQDYAAVTSPEEGAAGPGGRLLIVADGMGGARGGARASRVAAETIRNVYLQSGSADVAEVLRRAVTEANVRVYAESEATPDLRGMGTTASALVIRGGDAWFGHVGDSRIYLLRRDELKQLTEDHSLVASMVREGLLTHEEAESHPRRNILQRSVGVGAEVDIDVAGPISVEAGDTFIICSDGLHGVVKGDELKEVGRLLPDAAADEFVRRALSRGAPDNVTVIVARIERELIDAEATMKENAPVSLWDETIREPVPSPAAPAAPASGQHAAPRRAGSIFTWILLAGILLCIAAIWFSTGR